MDSSIKIHFGVFLKSCTILYSSACHFTFNRYALGLYIVFTLLYMLAHAYSLQIIHLLSATMLQDGACPLLAFAPAHDGHPWNEVCGARKQDKMKTKPTNLKNKTIDRHVRYLSQARNSICQ